MGAGAVWDGGCFSRDLATSRAPAGLTVPEDRGDDDTALAARVVDGLAHVGGPEDARPVVHQDDPGALVRGVPDALEHGGERLVAQPELVDGRALVVAVRGDAYRQD